MSLNRKGLRYPASKILVIATRQLGDVLLITPLLRSLRHAYQPVHIDVLVYRGKAVILQGNEDCDGVIEVSEHPRFVEYWQLLQKLWKGYDLAISTLAGDRPHIYAWLAARQRVNIVPPARWQDAWKRWVAHSWLVLDDKDTHTVLQYLQLADLLEIKKDFRLRLPQSPTADLRLNTLLSFDWQTQKFVVLHLVPLWPYKRWTQAGWQTIAHYLHQQGFKIVLTGSQNRQEQAYIQTCLSVMPPVINLAGLLDFAEVSQLIQASTLYIGPDTAVTHLAAATGTATIALFGPTNPVKWAPFPAGYAQMTNPFQRRGCQQVNNVWLIQGDAPCVPCHQEGCERHRASYSECLDNLAAETVIAAITKIVG